MGATTLSSQGSGDRMELGLLGLALAFLLLGCVALALSPVVRPGEWLSGAARLGHWPIVPAWLAAAAAGHVLLRKRSRRRDPLLFPVAMLLAGWGVLLIWRLVPGFGARQLVWLCLAVGAMMAVVLLPARLEWLRRYRYLWLLLGLVLTALTLVLGTHPSGGSPRLWLGCCGIFFQPSEILRLLLVVFFASYLADRIQLGWRRGPPSLWATLAPLLAVWGVSTLLVLAQRDLGSGMMLLALLTALLYLASGRWEVVVVSLVLALLGGGAAALTSEVVQSRLAAYVNPWQDPLGGSYQIVQSLIGIASGGLLGSGPGLGAPGYVPVAHSDFIFASIAEEWGLAGAVALLALLAVLVGRGLHIGAASPDPFQQMLAGGLAINLGLQAVFILAGVLRVLPLTGITLPFVSYGGTSLLSSFLSLGLLLVMSTGTATVEQRRRPFENVFTGFIAAIVVLSLAAGYWGIVRAPTIVSRTDNLRRVEAESFSLRGRILDRNGTALAESVGQAGKFVRSYSSAATASVLGFDSPAYGLMGIEQSMDRYLRGEEGAPFLQVLLSEVMYGYPPAGKDLRLTLDLEIQDRVFEAMLGERGAALVMDPSHGDVLAMVSVPSFDPATLIADWEQLLEDPGAPLLNRALQSSYQPGLALAPWVVAWSLENNEASLEDPVPDVGGSFAVDGVSLACARPPAQSTLGAGLQAGCPTPLAALGTVLGPEALEAAMQSLPGGGAVPGDLAAAMGDDSATDLERLAVGQSWRTLTPLELARAWAATTGEGALPPVRLVDAVQGADGRWHAWPELEREIHVFSPETARQVAAALQAKGMPGPSYSGEAIAGADQGRLAWYLARAGEEASAPVIVVVLEQSDLDRAGRIGDRILRAVTDLHNP